jgi:AmmeMemoRadiSam system protein A
LLRIARQAIARRFGPLPIDAVATSPDGSSEIDRTAAVFVTLRVRDGESRAPKLRGCIGTLEARMPLREAVAEYAVQAAFADPRFPPLERAELERLTIHLSVLGPRRPVATLLEIELGRDGVILELGRCRSVFLPEVAIEQHWDAERLLEQLARKAGLERGAWRNAQLWAFETESFEESPSLNQGAGG